MVRWLLCMSMVLLVSACQQASTIAPTASREELQREQQAQAELAKQGKQAISQISKAELVAKMKRVTDRVQPASVALCRDMFMHSRPCQFGVELAKEGGLNAYADGEKVVMFPEMVAFTANDEELALVLAHEFAHNIMSHPNAQQQNVAMGSILGTIIDQVAASQGINTGGALGKLGAQGAVMRYTPGFEREADYAGLYILARAGYDIAKTPHFWRRMSLQNPDSIYIGTTHPTNPDRYLTLEKTIAEINDKRVQGVPLVPERKPE